jgi:carbon monoxide dehydrogenase subunit G
MSALRQAAALTKRLDRPDLAAAGQSVVSDAEADGELFEGSVEVDVGPLADFAKLVGFEDAARSIAGAADISIKRFSGGRATLAMTLSEPVRLLRELERRSDLEFRVRDTRSDKLVLDVEDDPAP